VLDSWSELLLPTNTSNIASSSSSSSATSMQLQEWHRDLSPLFEVVVTVGVTVVKKKTAVVNHSTFLYPSIFLEAQPFLSQPEQQSF
jgi:hypothetical protein